MRRPCGSIVVLFLMVFPLSEHLRRDFPGAALTTMRMTGISLIEHLDTLSNRPSGPALAGAGVPSPDVLSFLARIEGADPNAPGLSEDDIDAGWGHYQFTAASLTVQSTLTSPEAVGDTITALRLIAAAIKTCKVAREMCRRHHISPTSFLSDMYLDRVVETLWELVKDIPIRSRVRSFFCPSLASC